MGWMELHLPELTLQVMSVLVNPCGVTYWCTEHGKGFTVTPSLSPDLHPQAELARTDCSMQCE